MEITLLRDGSLLAVKPLDAGICRLLEAELTYTKVKFNYGAQNYGKSKCEFEPTACYRYTRGQLITAFGYFDLLVAVLKRHGHTVRYKDLRPTKHPERFAPNWSQLEGVELRYKQRDVLEAIASHECGRIDCPTGYGKSFLVHLVARVLHRANIHVITKSAVLLRGMYHDLCSLLPSVGLVGSGKNVTGARVQLYTADSLHHSDFDADIVIADEVHELATPKYLKLLARYRYARVYGLSASQDQRLDKADFELHGRFGPIIFEIPYEEAEAAGVVVPIEIHWTPVLMDYNPCEGHESTSKARHGIWRNRVRNELIAGIANEYSPDEQVLISVETIEHAVHLKGLLPDFTICYSPDGMSLEQRARFMRWGLIDKHEPHMSLQRALELKEDFETCKLKKAIATSVWNRGVDFRQLRVLIRADAGGSPINDTQIPGRVSRIHDAKSYSVIHDFMDHFDRGYLRKSRSRERSYLEKGWRQLNEDSSDSRFRQSFLGG